jgi:hypothetical protein
MNHLLFEKVGSKYSHETISTGEDLLFQSDFSDQSDDIVYYVKQNEDDEWVINNMGVLVILPVFTDIPLLPEVYNSIRQVINGRNDNVPTYVSNSHIFIPEEFLKESLSAADLSGTTADTEEGVEVYTREIRDDTPYIGIKFNIIPITYYKENYVGMDVSDIADTDEQQYVLKDTVYWPVLRQATKTEQNILKNMTENYDNKLSRKLLLPEEVIETHNKNGSSVYTKGSLSIRDRIILYSIDNFAIKKFLQSETNLGSIDGVIKMDRLSEILSADNSIGLSSFDPLPLIGGISYASLNKVEYKAVGKKELFNYLNTKEIAVEEQPSSDRICLKITSPESVDIVSEMNVQEITWSEEIGGCLAQIRPEVKKSSDLYRTTFKSDLHTQVQ